MHGLGQGSNLIGLYTHNRSVVLDILRHFGPLSVSELAERMGLRSASVGSMVKELMELGFVESAGLGKSSGGRPPVLYRVKSRGRCALVADLSGAQIVTGVVDVGGEVVRQDTYARPADPNQVFDALCNALERTKGSLEHQHLVGIGVAVPGLIDSESGTVTLSAPLRWTDFPLADRLQERFGLSVVIGKETESAILAEYYQGERGSTDNLLLLNIGTGVGVGMILAGQPYRGSHDTAGEWGHTVAVPDGPLCWCGNRGCLEEVASLHALVRYVDNKYAEMEKGGNGFVKEDASGLWTGGDLQRGAEWVLQQASFGDRTCLEAVEQVAAYLGQGLFNLIQLFDPKVVVIDVSVREGAEILTAAIERHLNQYRLLAPGPITIRQPVLQSGSGKLVGAGLWVFDQALQSMKKLLVES